MSETFTPTAKFMNVRAHWSPDFYNEGPEGNKLRWTEAQVILAEVAPCIFGLIVCDAIRVADVHVRRAAGGAMVCKNVMSASFTMDTLEVRHEHVGLFTMDTLERLHIATFTETPPTTQAVHFHIRFPSLADFIEFTRAVNDVKLDLEGLHAEMEDGFTAAFDMLPSA